MASLKSLCKKRILDELIRNTAAPHNYIAMVVDVHTLRILSACCNVYDVLEQGVTVIELIAKQRQPLPELDALYFLSPTQDSINALIKDFQSGNHPQYRSAHVFFCSAIAPNTGIMEKVADSARLLPRIRAFAELNLSFIAYEQRVFHLDLPGCLLQLFPLAPHALLEDITERLVTLCASLGYAYPIRFHRSSFPWAEQVATLLHQKLLSRNLPVPENSVSSFVILDRSIDLAPLFVHEYTYQALSYDLLNIPICSTQNDKGNSALEDVFEYEVTSNTGTQDKKTAILGEQDELWIQYRHRHIQEVNQRVREEIQSFVKDNATARMQKTMASEPEDTLRIIRSLPQYQEMLAKYWIHVTLSEKCFDQLQACHIMKIGSIEQDLCCGVDKYGKEIDVPKVETALTSLLSDSQIRMEDKMRLLFLYFTQVSGIDESERRKMIETAQMSLINQRCISCFMRLDLHASSLRVSHHLRKHAHRLEEGKERIKFFKQRAKKAQYELSRFVPAIKDIMQKAVQDTLHGGYFPYVDEPVRSQERPQPSKAKQVASSLIGRATDWDWNSSNDHSTPRDASKSCVIVFVLGGITQSEMRSAYEVSKDMNCDVYIGGTSILTPSQLLNTLKAYTMAG